MTERILAEHSHIFGSTLLLCKTLRLHQLVLVELLLRPIGVYDTGALAPGAAQINICESPVVQDDLARCPVVL